MIKENINQLRNEKQLEFTYQKAKAIYEYSEKLEIKTTWDDFLAKLKEWFKAFTTEFDLFISGEGQYLENADRDLQERVKIPVFDVNMKENYAPPWIEIIGIRLKPMHIRLRFFIKIPEIYCDQESICKEFLEDLVKDIEDWFPQPIPKKGVKSDYPSTKIYWKKVFARYHNHPDINTLSTLAEHINYSEGHTKDKHSESCPKYPNCSKK